MLRKNDDVNYKEIPPKNFNEAHIPVGLLVDVSGSMAEKIKAVEKEINKLQVDLRSHSTAAKMVETAIITFNDTAQCVQDWRPVTDTNPVVLEANGGTELNSALMDAMDSIRERYRLLQKQGIEVRRPQLFLVTDGFGGDVTEAARQIHQRTQDGKLLLWVLAIKGYDKQTVATLTDGVRVFELKDEDSNDFSEFFERVVKASVIAISESTKGTTPNWENPLKDENSTLKKADLDKWLDVQC